MLEIEPLAQDGELGLTRVQADGPHERYTCRLRACTSPVCHCTVLSLRCAPASEAARRRCTEAGAETLEADLDVFAQSVAEPEERVPGAARVLAEQIAAELTEGQWAELRERFLAAKRRAIERMNVDELETGFRFDEIELESALVGYREVFPFAAPFVLEHAGRKLLADDLYCLAPACRCTDALLCFFPPSDATGSRPPDDERALRVDYRRGRWTDADTSEPVRREGDPWADGLCTAYPDLLQTLATRHGQLRRIYHRSRRLWLDESAAAPPSTTRKVGRNQPCPCGSGKKFKKCCGR
jgi:hypothetical protein